MENSIETIWKKGFIASDSLIAPKVNDLYNQKSQTIIDRLKRMMKINIYAIVIFGVANIGLYAILGALYAGIFIFLLLMGVCWLSLEQSKGMKNIDTALNSYDYLRSFNDWIKTAIANNARVMRFFYPLVFLASLMPVVHALKAGEATNAAIANSGFHLFYGIPTFVWIIAMGVAIIMFAFGGKIYQWDVNLVYKRIFRKLETMIAEMEELKN